MRLTSIELTGMCVTPYMGVCIETPTFIIELSIVSSHPIWVCVLKHRKQYNNQLPEEQVTPYMGVCIETLNVLTLAEQLTVTPYMGVCIETCDTIYIDHNGKSHPIWVCVLKHQIHCRHSAVFSSHPIWVCVLKQTAEEFGYHRDLSHPIWVCVLKQRRKDTKFLHTGHTLYGCVY